MTFEYCVVFPLKTVIKCAKLYNPYSSVYPTYNIFLLGNAKTLTFDPEKQ
jgi:hypothetical protein